ncbi:hypothetical protein NN561_000496 [Cricetulus griseus]
MGFRVGQAGTRWTQERPQSRVPSLPSAFRGQASEPKTAFHSSGLPAIPLPPPRGWAGGRRGPHRPRCCYAACDRQEAPQDRAARLSPPDPGRAAARTQ